MKKIRYIPYGYTIRNGRTIIEHAEADVIREVFDAYIGGASLKDIADELTAKKIPYSERSDTWDKARIARIIDNAKYIGDEEYDPIIDEQLYEMAVNTKISRQRNAVERENAAIGLLRDCIRCEKCGAPMKRKITSKLRIKESWTCSNDACGLKVRISDTALLEKIVVIMNRIISNAGLLIPKKNKRHEMSLPVKKLNNEISLELELDYPREEYIIAKTVDMASLLYQECSIKESITAAIARKRASMMQPLDTFSTTYFTDLIEYITLDGVGRVTLHTKTDAEIGDECYGNHQDTEEENHNH